MAQTDPTDTDILTRRLLKRVAGLSLEEQRALLEILEARSEVEKRDLPRRPLVLEVAFGEGSCRYRDYALDISAGGMFIETGERFAVGDRIRLAFRLPNFGTPIRLSGRVVRTSPTGIGVRFDWRLPPG